MLLRVQLIGCCVLLCCPGTSWSALAKQSQQATKSVDYFLKEGRKRLSHRNSRKRQEGFQMLFKAYKMAPNEFKTLLGASEACFARANWSKKKSDIARWGRKGWHYSKKVMKRWPKRAEGYYWSSINLGQYARGGGVWVALSKGLAGKIERLALASLRRNPKLYKGAAQRVLGRYYYSLPWPMRKLKKSRKYLEAAHRIAPNHPGGQLFLGETLWKLGYKKRALKLFGRCGKRKFKNMHFHNVAKKCAALLKKHR